jgi:hypothetical protein
MSGISGISAATRTAVVGIQNVSNRVDRTAANVVSAGFSTDTVSISPEARAAAAASSSGDGDLVSNMVDLNVEKNSLAAQVKVLHTADDMTKDLLDIVK